MSELENYYSEDNEVASGDLLNDLGKLLEMDDNTIELARRRRRIRHLSYPLIMFFIFLALMLIGALLQTFANNSITQFIINISSAFAGFILGLASPLLKKFKDWVVSVNKKMHSCRGEKSIVKVIISETLPNKRFTGGFQLPFTIMQDGGNAVIAPNEERMKTKKRRMKHEFPPIARRWNKYFARGYKHPQLARLPFFPSDRAKEHVKYTKGNILYAFINNFRLRRQKKLILRISQFIFNFYPSSKTSEYLEDYAKKYAHVSIAKDEITKEYILLEGKEDGGEEYFVYREGNKGI